MSQPTNQLIDLTVGRDGQLHYSGAADLEILDTACHHARSIAQEQRRQNNQSALLFLAVLGLLFGSQLFVLWGLVTRPAPSPESYMEQVQ